MGKLFLKICLFAIGTVFLFAAKITYAEEKQQNNYPIILVNGFAGWGREEMLGVKYWGGVH
ncbi:lipase, partial [Bacillus wiedmannii]